MPRTRRPLAERFAAMCAPSTNEPGCIDWQGYCAPNGYGMLYRDGRTAYAHRVAYELSTGKPPEQGLDVAHLCNNPGCVNPAHLRLWPRDRNVAYAAESGRNRRANQTTCKRGHPFDRVRINRGQRGRIAIQRVCSTCRRASGRACSALLRARQAAAKAANLDA